MQHWSAQANTRLANTWKTWGGGQPTGIRLSEVHMGMANLTQLPSWKVEDLGMRDKRSAILKNFQ